VAEQIPGRKRKDDGKSGIYCVKTFIEKREELMKVTPHAAEFVPEKASVGIIRSIRSDQVFQERE
jgi:hypothetical protein